MSNYPENFNAIYVSIHFREVIQKSNDQVTDFNKSQNPPAPPTPLLNLGQI